MDTSYLLGCHHTIYLLSFAIRYLCALPATVLPVSHSLSSLILLPKNKIAELDEDRDGEIPRKQAANLLAKVGRNPKTCATQIATFCGGGVASTSPPPGGSSSDTGKNSRQQLLLRDSGKNDEHGNGYDDDGGGGGEEKRHQGIRRKSSGRGRGRGGSPKSGRSGSGGGGGLDNDENAPLLDRNRNRDRRGRVGFAAAVPSTTSLAEFLAFFGFAFEATGAAVKPSVAEAFAMLRLHAQPTEARAAGEAARRCVQ